MYDNALAPLRCTIISATFRFHMHHVIRLLIRLGQTCPAMEVNWQTWKDDRVPSRQPADWWNCVKTVLFREY